MCGGSGCEGGCGCSAEGCWCSGEGAESAGGEEPTGMCGGSGCESPGESACTGRLHGGAGSRCSTGARQPTEWGFVVNADGEVEQRSSLPWLLGLVDDHGRPTAAHQDGPSNTKGRENLTQTLERIARELCVGKPSQQAARGGERIMRFRLRSETYRYWKRLERLARPWLPRGVSFLRFISLCIWNAHRYEVKTTVAYSHIYARDGYRCTSPVCCRRTVQPHHIQPRSKGGGDESENLTSLCCDCHLEGVHQGRMAVQPPASRMLWSIGRDGGMVVLGRKKIRDVPEQEVGDDARGGDEAAA